MSVKVFIINQPSDASEPKYWHRTRGWIDSCDDATQFTPENMPAMPNSTTAFMELSENESVIFFVRHEKTLTFIRESLDILQN